MVRAVLFIALLIFVTYLIRGMRRPKPKPTKRPPLKTKETEYPFEGFEGTWSRAYYNVDQLNSRAITIWIDLSESAARPFEINARKSRPQLDHAGRRPHIEALLDMGANYIDVGAINKEWVAAEFPTNVEIDAAFAQKVTEQLVELRKKSASMI